MAADPTANAMVFLKIAIVIAVIVIGFFYVTPANWHPFLPNGFSGVMKGVSGVFFAYIGFDAVSTAAQESKNPQRDMPIGIMGSLAICTVLYILVSAVMTGIILALFHVCETSWRKRLPTKPHFGS